MCDRVHVFASRLDSHIESNCVGVVWWERGGEEERGGAPGWVARSHDGGVIFCVVVTHCQWVQATACMYVCTDHACSRQERGWVGA